MATLWDEGLKRLFRASPQDFISWLAPGATYQKMILTELHRKLDSHRKVIAEVYQFHFLTVSLWEHSAQELLEGGLSGLLALLPLTRDGKDPAVIDVMIARLQAHENYEMLSLGYLFTALTWTRENERAWIQRRFAMLRDELRESWAFQEILQEGEQKGEQKGLIQAVLTIVETRFPTLLPQAKALVERVHDPQALQHLIVMLTLAGSAEEASQSLSNGASAP